GVMVQLDKLVEGHLSAFFNPKDSRHYLKINDEQDENDLFNVIITGYGMEDNKQASLFVGEELMRYATEVQASKACSTWAVGVQMELETRFALFCEELSVHICKEWNQLVFTWNSYLHELQNDQMDDESSRFVPSLMQFIERRPFQYIVKLPYERIGDWQEGSTPTRHPHDYKEESWFDLGRAMPYNAPAMHCVVRHPLWKLCIGQTREVCGQFLRRLLPDMETALRGHHEYLSKQMLCKLPPSSVQARRGTITAPRASVLMGAKDKEGEKPAPSLPDSHLAYPSEMLIVMFQLEACLAIEKELLNSLPKEKLSFELKPQRGENCDVFISCGEEGY
ncbi:hypothetical protein CYMTET_34989, partial [Cymbomonas tetramitiformis]